MSIGDPPSRELVRALATGAVSAALAACADLGRSARTSLTSGDPKPEAAPTRSRTIDSTGFVDNGGRTSDEWGRPSTSGARATEIGGHPPTGTNTGVPVGANLGGRAGRRERREPVPPGARLAPGAGGAPLADEPGTTSRLARARCDRETACGRIGAGRAWPSQSACMTAMHATTSAELWGEDCDRDQAAVTSCLDAVRGASCDQRLDRVDSLQACSVSALCRP